MLIYGQGNMIHFARCVKEGFSAANFKRTRHSCRPNERGNELTRIIRDWLGIWFKRQSTLAPSLNPTQTGRQFKASLAKKLNNFKTIQAMTAKLSDFS